MWTLPPSSIAKTIEPPSQIGSRRSGIGVAVAVERRGQDAPVLAGLGVDDRDLGVARKVEVRPDPT